MDNKEYYELIHFHIDELKQFSENLKNMTAKVLGNNLLLWENEVEKALVSWRDVS